MRERTERFPPARRLVVRIAVAVATVLGQAAIVSAQTRFEAVADDPIAGVTGLRAVTVRDSVAGACYVVFVMEPSLQIRPGAPAALPDVERASATLDRRLADLIAAFERDLSAIPGMPASNSLRYQWEARKAQHDFDLAVLSKELAELGRQLESTTAMSRLTAAINQGPCTADGRRKGP
jgi:hypothetical protein